MFLHDAGINISTREPAVLRDKLIYLGATIMSAGSKTEPGGYSAAQDDAAQFSIEDNRLHALYAEKMKIYGSASIFLINTLHAGTYKKYLFYNLLNQAVNQDQ